MNNNLAGDAYETFISQMMELLRTQFEYRDTLRALNGFEKEITKLKLAKNQEISPANKEKIKSGLKTLNSNLRKLITISETLPRLELYSEIYSNKKYEKTSEANLLHDKLNQDESCDSINAEMLLETSTKINEIAEIYRTLFDDMAIKSLNNVRDLGNKNQYETQINNLSETLFNIHLITWETNQLINGEKPDGKLNLFNKLDQIIADKKENESYQTNHDDSSIFETIKSIIPFVTLGFCIFITLIVMFPMKNEEIYANENQNLKLLFDNQAVSVNSHTTKELNTLPSKIRGLPDGQSIVNTSELDKVKITFAALIETNNTIKDQVGKDQPWIKFLEKTTNIDKTKLEIIQDYITKEIPKTQKNDNDKANDITLRAKQTKDLYEKETAILKEKELKLTKENENLKELLKNKDLKELSTKESLIAIILPVEKSFSPNKPIFDNLVAQLKNDLAKNKIMNARIFWESNAQIEEYTEEAKANMMQRNWDGGVSEPEMATAKNVLEKMEFKRCQVFYILGPNSTVVPKIETAMYLNGNKCSIINIRTSDKLNTRFLNSWLEVAKINGGAFRMVDALNNNPTDIIKEIINIAQNK